MRPTKYERTLSKYLAMVPEAVKFDLQMRRLERWKKQLIPVGHPYEQESLSVVYEFNEGYGWVDRETGDEMLPDQAERIAQETVERLERKGHELYDMNLLVMVKVSVCLDATSDMGMWLTVGGFYFPVTGSERNDMKPRWEPAKARVRHWRSLDR